MNYNNSNYNYEEYFNTISKDNEEYLCNNHEKSYNNGYEEDYNVNLEVKLENSDFNLQSEPIMKQNNLNPQNMFQGFQKNQYTQKLTSRQDSQSAQGFNNFQNIKEVNEHQLMHKPIKGTKTCNVKNLNNVIPIPGQVRKCNQHCNINGKNFVVNNKNFYNRYFTRYNHFFINDCNYIKDFLSDCNIYHFSSQTIYNGCKYLGSNAIVANNCFRNFNNNCCFNNNIF